MELNTVRVNGVDYSVDDLSTDEQDLLKKASTCKERLEQAEFAFLREKAAYDFFLGQFGRSIQERSSKGEIDLDSGAFDVGKPNMAIN